MNKFQYDKKREEYQSKQTPQYDHSYDYDHSSIQEQDMNSDDSSKYTRNENRGDVR